MSLFHKDTLFDNIPSISVYPKARSAILRVEDSLVIFSPSYLLGKHGEESKEVSSKFLNLRTGVQLLEILKKNISSGDLKGERVEIKEVDTKVAVGEDTLVHLDKHLRKVVPQEEVRGGEINVIYTTKKRIPQTSLMNFILVEFDSQYGNGVDEFFTKKYPGLSFDSFKGVYTILTMFPGKYAPPFNDTRFWDKHALLKELK